MNIDNVILGLDKMFDSHMEDQIEDYLAENIVTAIGENDTASVLILLNEMVGFLRSCESYEKSLIYAGKAVELIINSGLEGTVHHATTLINQATAMRAAGKLKESVSKYEEALKIYESQLSEGAFEFAPLFNNMSLVYMELENFTSAKDCLLKAIAIAEKYDDKEFEVAVSNTNLGNTYIALKDYKNAKTTLDKAIEYFETNNVMDTHYAAALMGIADIVNNENDYSKAISLYEKSMQYISDNYGYTEFYYRVKERLNACIDTAKTANIPVNYGMKGIDLSQEYFENVVKGAIEKECPEVMDTITVGLFGMGSDCFGLDDSFSKDHDWGPGVCIFLDTDDYEKYSLKLKSIYESLPKEYAGYKRIDTSYGKGRVGILNTYVFTIDLLGEQFGKIIYEAAKNDIDIHSLIGNRELDTIYLSVPENSFANFINGNIFKEGNDHTLSKIRQMLMRGYPLHLKYLKMAQSFALFSQNLQYNLRRVLLRKDVLSAAFMIDNGVKEAYHIGYLLNDKYMPHDKWIIGLFNKYEKDGYLEGLGNLVQEIYDEFDKVKVKIRENSNINITEHILKPLNDKISVLADYIIEEGKRAGLLTNGGYEATGSYLEDKTTELSNRAFFADMNEKTLVDAIVRLEWEAFDKVKNEGGRAECQDNFKTFSVMRKSQYNTWNKLMLIQYANDFTLANSKGWNLITEKYGRMEASTAPDRWKEICGSFRKLSERKRSTIEEIVKTQVSWMEDFAIRYPKLAQNARSIHTYEDNMYNTSYETYLRGELSTYTDQMIYLYGLFIVGLVKNNSNLAELTMKETVKLYGYSDLDSAESAL